MSSINKYMPKFLNRNFLMKMAIPILFVMIFSPNIISSFNTYGLQPTDCFAPLTTNIDPNYQGPVVIDSYWVDQGTGATNSTNNNPTKKEVGPGEGTSVFAVVLNNRGSTSIDAITAFLTLPGGFVPTGESKNPQLLQGYNQASRVAGPTPATASYYGTVVSGATFTLYFNIDILPSAKVNTYAGTLVANYFQVGNAGTCTSALLDVPFVLPGKVVLDASAATTDILPQVKSPLTITIENKGSADAAGVIVTIQSLGNSKTGSAQGSSGNSVVLQSATTDLINLGPNTFNIGTIHPHSKAEITTTVYPSSNAGGTTQAVNLGITYQNAWGKFSSTSLATGVVVAPNPPQSLSLSYIGNSTTPLITAGNLDSLNFAVANNSTDPMSNIVISLVPQSSSVSIVGASTWTIQNMQPGDRQVLSTKVFAANTLINTPASFTLTASYVSKGQSLTNSLTLGTFVVGNIKLQIYDLSVSFLGGTPNIAGNLLNQGSTTGLYTTIQLAPSPLLDAIRSARLANSTNNPEGQSIPQAAGQSNSGFTGQGGQGFQGQGGNRRGGPTTQFIGDLTPDSPIPFSIPMRSISLLQPGPYQVAFKVTYADDLKNFHDVILNGTVNISKNPQLGNSQSQQTSLLDQISLPVVIGAVIATAVGIVFMIRRKRSANKKLKLVAKSDDDIVSIFDSDKKKKDES